MLTNAININASCKFNNTNKKSAYIPNIKDITYNTNQNEDEKKLDLDDDFSWVFDEDCAVTTSSIGPAVQYTADKELDEIKEWVNNHNGVAYFFQPNTL